MVYDMAMTKAARVVRPTPPEMVSQESKSRKVGWRRIPKQLWALFGGIALVFGFLGLNAFDMLPAKRYTVLVPLYATTDEYLRFMRGERLSEFDREVSAELKAAIETARRRWVSGDGAEQTKRQELLDRVDFFFYPEGVSIPTYRSAFEKALAIQEQDKREVVAAIGHVTSTATEAHAEHYDDTDIPIILPLATATSLIDTLNSRSVEAIRLVPNNRKQAERIARYLLGKEEKIPTGWLPTDTPYPRALVVVDMSNPAYSTDLLDEFRNQFSRLPFKDAGGAEEPISHGQIVASIPVGAPGAVPLINGSLGELSPDALLLFGMTEQAMEVMAQAEAAGLSVRTGVLTDGAIDDYLLPRIQAVRQEGLRIRSLTRGNEETNGESAVLSNLLLAFPVSEREWVLMEEISQTRQTRMGHSLYVMDAAQILLDALSRFEQRTLKFGSGRRFIKEEFRRWKRNGSITVSFTHRPKHYMIDSRGESVVGCYYLWGMRESTSGELEWKLVTPGECPG